MGEPDHQRRSENQHHDRDHYQIRQSDIDKRPVENVTRMIQVDRKDARAGR
jgi:hypothetical protein